MMSAGKFEEAISKFESALNFDNTNPDWFFDLGRCVVKLAPLFQNGAKNLNLRCGLRPSKRRCWEQNTARIQND